MVLDLNSVQRAWQRLAPASSNPVVQAIERDLLMARHEVRPILGRLARSMAWTTGLLLVGASLCQAL